MTLESNGGPGLDGEIARLGPWFHNLHLADGLQTAPDHPLGDFPARKWKELATALPDDLRGCRALDVGCNAGFYSFALADRGAEVLAIDHDEHYLAQARWARDRLGYNGRVELRCLSAYGVGGIEERFDIVLFMGVLYHLRHPLLALDLVSERTAGTLVVQTLTMPGPEQEEVSADLSLRERGRLTEPGWPAMAFIEHHMAGDHTNWWVPNASAVEAMLRTTGMRVVDRPGHEIWVCERERGSHHREELDRANGRG